MAATALPAHRTRLPARWPSLLAFVAVAEAAGLVGIPFTSTGAWYDSLDTAPFNPPSWVFGPVWTTLYVVVGVAGWRLWTARASDERTTALRWWVGQLVLNALWTPVFFGARSPGWGLAVIVAMVAAIGVTVVRARRVDRTAALLLVPYAAWVVFATVLNAWIVVGA